MRSSTTTLITALGKIADCIQPEHHLEIEALREAAKRLEEAKGLVAEALKRLPAPKSGEIPDKGFPLFVMCLVSFLDERTAAEREQSKTG